MKHCTKCVQDKPLKAFSLDRTRKDGMQHTCRACKAVYMASYEPLASIPSTPRKSPSKPRGKPARSPRRRCVTHSSGGDVIRDLLVNTVWPQSLIADLAQCSVGTVSRILKNSDILTPRPTYHVRSIRRAPDLQLTRRLWNHFLTQRTKNGPLSALTIARCTFKVRSASIRPKDTSTRERLKRLKAGKSTRDLDSGTNLNEGHVSKMLPLMLIYNAMYGSILPSPDLAGREADLSWLPEEWRPAVAKALGQEYP